MNIIGILLLTLTLSTPVDGDKKTVKSDKPANELKQTQPGPLLSPVEEARIESWEKESNALQAKEEEGFLIDFIPVSNSQMPLDNM